MQKSSQPYYIVKRTDTLSSIAARHNLTPSQILVENYLTPAGIREGTILSITRHD